MATTAPNPRPLSVEPGYRTVLDGPLAGPLRVGLVYDLDACRSPTGVTRHALGQLDRLARRPDVRLTVISGRIAEPDGLAYWERIGDLDPAPRRRQLPIGTKQAIRAWRVAGWPPVEWWSGPIDWSYAPAELFIPTRKARKAVTSHDIRQDLTLGGPRRRAVLDRAFAAADLVLSVSGYNTTQLLDAYPNLRDRVAIVPNAADDLFYDSPTATERRAIRIDLGLPTGVPYLLSVANFQPRKNLNRLIRAAGRLVEVRDGDLALVLIGDGDESESRKLQEAAAAIGPKAIVRFPGYRQGPKLRAAYAEAAALVFASTCESFGIPAVEAMAVGCPLVLAGSTALPEIAGPSAIYFDPEDPEAIAGAIRDVLDDQTARERRVEIGRDRASRYRWDAANDRLVAALRDRL